MKTKEELNALKEEVDALNKKLAELTVEELAQIAGGMDIGGAPPIESGHSSLSLPDMVAELEKRGLANTNPLSKLTNVDTMHTQH